MMQSHSFYIHLIKEKMIELKNVKKKFRNKVVLDDISFNVSTGKIMALIGANGAGKSTIIRLISTIYAQDEGEIIVDGLNTKKNPNEVRRKIGVLLGGDVFLYNSLSARENILYFANLQGVPSKEANIKLEQLVKMLSMEQYLDERVDKFSRGMKQKVAIVRTLIHSPQILLLDEPSTGLDIDSLAIIHSFILECRNQGKTILLSTHNVNEMALCDNYIFLKNGRIASRGNKQDFQEEDALKGLFVY